MVAEIIHEDNFLDQILWTSVENAKGRKKKSTKNDYEENQTNGKLILWFYQRHPPLKQLSNHPIRAHPVKVVIRKFAKSLWFADSQTAYWFYRYFCNVAKSLRMHYHIFNYKMQNTTLWNYERELKWLLFWIRFECKAIADLASQWVRVWCELPTGCCLGAMHDESSIAQRSQSLPPALIILWGRVSAVLEWRHCENRCDKVALPEL